MSPKEDQCGQGHYSYEEWLKELGVLVGRKHDIGEHSKCLYCFNNYY